MASEVTLLVGPVRSGKTKHLLHRYRQVLRQKVDTSLPKCLWIGPDQLTVTQLRDSFLESSEAAYLGLNILTFAGYAESIVAASPERIRPISRLQKRRLLQFATANAIEAGLITHYAQVATTPGFLAQTSELISDLKRRDVWPDQLAKRCQEQREHELAAIFDRYQQYLLNFDLYDAEGRFWAARDLLAKQSAPGSTPEYALLVVDGFTDFTSAQYDILKRLAENSAELQISLTLEQMPDPVSGSSPEQETGRSLFAKTAETYRRLQQIFPKLQVRTEWAAEEDGPQSVANGLQHVAKYLYCEPDELLSTQADSTGIEILAASSVQQEVVEIAGRIKGLLSSGEAGPQEIVLVFRSLEEISPRICEIFNDHGIPFAIESQARLIATPLLRGILSLLRLCSEDWPFRHVLEVVGNRMFRLFEGDCTESEICHSRSAIERCVRWAQLPAGRQALLDQLQRWVEATESGSDEFRRQTAETELGLRQLQRLAKVLDALPRVAPLSKWIEQLQAVLVGLGTLADEQPAGDFTPAMEMEGDKNRTLKDTWQLLQRSLHAVDSLDTHTKNNKATLTILDFLEILQTVARDQRLAGNFNATGRVRVLSAESGRHISAKYLFLAGLGEQSFASLGSSNPLFDVRRLHQPAGTAGNGTTAVETFNNEAMQLFYELVTRATGQLTLSYPAMDAKGQALSPSPLLVELRRCFGGVTIREEKASLGDFVQTDSDPQSETSFRQQAVARAIDGKQEWLAGLISEPSRASLAQAVTTGIHCIAERGRREEFGAYEGLVLGEVAQKVLSQRFDSEHLWSASQLEKYATCPFRFFGEQLLSLEPPEELALRNDALRRGSLLHQVLATLHQHAQGDTKSENMGDAADLVQRFCQALQETIDATPLYGLQQALREIERREIEALAPQYAEQEVDYRARWQHLDQPLQPQFFEVRFGPKRRSSDEADDSGSSALPFELDLGDEKILLTGQIDRVDVGQVSGVTVFNIIDYKSGKEVRLKDEKVRSGQQLQLPLYAMAAEKLLLADQDGQAMATGYWSIAGKGFQSGRSGALEVRQLENRKLKTSKQWDDLQPVLLERVKQLVNGIRDGQFPVYNTDDNCTRSCNLATICRVAHIRSLEKHWEPPTES